MLDRYLVISRKKDERTTIFSPDGKPLGAVVVIGIRDGKVRLGFDFPRDHMVLRDELVQAKPDGREDASRGGHEAH